MTVQDSGRTFDQTLRGASGFKSKWLPIAAKSLKSRCVNAPDGVIHGAALFPMFTRQGDVRQWMFVDRTAGEVRFLDSREPAPRIRFFRKLHVTTPWCSMQRMDNDAAVSLQGLYHFDPWWMLADDGFHDQPWTDFLRATNCGDTFESVIFDRKLSRVVYVVIKGRSAESMSKLRPGMLPKPAALPVNHVPGNSPSRRGWRLDPFWMRHTAD